MDTLHLLDIINEHKDTSFRLISKFNHGAQGAFFIEDQSGEAYVLKWSDHPSLLARLDDAASYTALLKRKGYPLPLYTHIGHALGGKYTIQEKLTGTTCNPDNLHKYLPQILELNELQKGEADQGTWPSMIVNAVIYGQSEFCSHEQLLQFSSTTAELLTILTSITAKFENKPYRTNDIVHFDFHHQNLLVDHDQISGVVDWQFPCAGDCTFDLLTLMLYSEPESATWIKLKKITEDQVGKEIISIYLSYLLLRQVGWCIQHWPEWLEHWFKVAKKVLA
ncbi:hypothetical protein A8709_14855 [Paenibacillus pectinilyticus]|uniref:Aminoglycoside phosphotransferase domain-containing protein n=1 Tax=Paenibacillus pectinilyticus TaxID=512399 RepID=A0A1C1A470_9BACL|nr:aminoglycoside phosphotransferase family protein [Paenibacillus pectinilyticus]OCT15362.1 hypothetical protein A8709_14855 [Paenibacillus pectinilyticus]